MQSAGIGPLNAHYVVLREWMKRKEGKTNGGEERESRRDNGMKKENVHVRVEDGVKEW